MSYTGYRVYRGCGGLSSVDFTTIVGAASPGESSVEVSAAGHAPNATYTYVLRPVLDGRVTPDLSCAVEATFDAAGEWVGARPGPIIALTAATGPAGGIRLRWNYDDEGAAPAAAFAVYAGPDARVDTSGEAVVTVAATGRGEYAAELTWSDGQTGYVAVVARAADQTPGRPAIAGPIVADAAAPDALRVYAGGGF